MRTVFFGTPEIAVPALRELARTTELVGVVCQPDRPAGRGLKLRIPAVKQAASALGVPVFQPEKVKSGLAEWLLGQGADLAVVMAYGRLLPQAVLEAPRLGCVNLHASLLPRHRGAAPIQWALIEGDAMTGVSLMQMDAGMDTGPVFSERSLVVDPLETAEELGVRLGLLAPELVREDLPRVASGELCAVPQQHDDATPAPKLGREATLLDWNDSARRVVGWIQGLSPAPGASSLLRERRVVFLRARLAEGVPEAEAPAPGTILTVRGRLLVATGSGFVEILEARAESGKRVTGRDLANGLRLVGGERLGAL